MVPLIGLVKNSDDIWHKVGDPLIDLVQNRCHPDLHNNECFLKTMGLQLHNSLLSPRLCGSASYVDTNKRQCINYLYAGSNWNGWYRNDHKATIIEREVDQHINTKVFWHIMLKAFFPSRRVQINRCDDVILASMNNFTYSGCKIGEKICAGSPW